MIFSAWKKSLIHSIRNRGLQVAARALAWQQILCACIWGIICSSPAIGAEHAIAITNAQVGFEGNYKAGRWTTATLELQAKTAVQGTIHCRTMDGDGVPVTFLDPAGKFALQAGEKRSLTLLFQAGGIDSRLQARITLDNGTTWDELLAVPSPRFVTQEFIVQPGSSVGLEELPRFFRRREEQAFILSALNTADVVPTQPGAYEGVDWVVLPLSKDSLAENLSEEQVTAIKTWVRSGGKLVLTVASQGLACFSGEGKWADLAAGEIEGASRLKRTVGVESLGGATLNVDTLAVGQAPFVLDYKSYQGRVELWEIGGGAKDRPLAIRRSYGLGEVLVIGFDLDRPPWLDWPGRTRLIGSLLQQGRRTFPEQESGGIRGQASHLGYDDLTGQLRTSLEQYRQIVFLTFTVVAVMAGIYLVLIGPVDFFLLTYLGWPKHWTWGTLSVLVVLFSGVGWWLAERCHGRQIWVNQAEIVDFDLQTGKLRGTAWVHLYSPDSDRYNLQWQPTKEAVFKADSASLSWQGLAGRGWGGLNRSSQGSFSQRMRERGYEVAWEDSAAIRELPIAIAGSKPLTVTWNGSHQLPKQELKSNAFGQLEGEVTNPLPFELADCRVLYDEYMYRIPRPLAAGQTYSLNLSTPLNLESRLTERMVIEQKDMATPWNPARTDLPRIMEMLMFHEAANGAGYTGLLHRHQPWLDMSAQLRMNRAILVGCSTVAQGELQRDGESLADKLDHAEKEPRTWYRIVIPVAQPQPKTEVEQP